MEYRLSEIEKTSKFAGWDLSLSPPALLLLSPVSNELFQVCAYAFTDKSSFDSELAKLKKQIKEFKTLFFSPADYSFVSAITRKGWTHKLKVIMPVPTATLKSLIQNSLAKKQPLPASLLLSLIQHLLKAIDVLHSKHFSPGPLSPTRVFLIKDQFKFSYEEADKIPLINTFRSLQSLINEQSQVYLTPEVYEALSLRKNVLPNDFFSAERFGVGLLVLEAAVNFNVIDYLSPLNTDHTSLENSLNKLQLIYQDCPLLIETIRRTLKKDPSPFPLTKLMGERPSLQSNDNSLFDSADNLNSSGNSIMNIQTNFDSFHLEQPTPNFSITNQQREEKAGPSFFDFNSDSTSEPSTTVEHRPNTALLSKDKHVLSSSTDIDMRKKPCEGFFEYFQ